MNSEQARSSGQEVTLPYPRRSDRKRRTVLIEINSRDRNKRTYPNSSEFRFRLFRPLKDVTQIQLAGGSIPSCVYNMNRGWNKFTFIEDDIFYDVELLPGKYNYLQLATEVANKLNTLPGIKNKYDIEFSTITGKMSFNRISNTKTFGLLFATGNFVDLVDANNTLQTINSPAHLFGFEKADYYSNGLGLITTPYVTDLDFLLTRFYLYVNHDNNQDFGLIERAVGRAQPHAIVYMDGCSGNYKFLNKETYEPVFEAKPAPIARMATLDIALRDEFDRLIDLNGRDFTLLLEIEYCE